MVVYASTVNVALTPVSNCEAFRKGLRLSYRLVNILRNERLYTNCDLEKCRSHCNHHSSLGHNCQRARHSSPNFHYYHNHHRSLIHNPRPGRQTVPRRDDNRNHERMRLRICFYGMPLRPLSGVRDRELGLDTVEHYEKAIRAFTHRTNIIVKRELYQGDGHSEHELIDLAERFALLTRDSLANAKLQRSFATFQVLILLSYCEVLRKRGLPYETIDRIIQHVAGQESVRRRLLGSALWINGIIVDLVSHGWTVYRATELFFIGMFSNLHTYGVELTPFSDALSLTYLTHIHNNENSQSILEYLKRDEFVKHDYSDCLRPEYTIPGLIASLLDGCNITANKPSYGFPVLS